MFCLYCLPFAHLTVPFLSVYSITSDRSLPLSSVRSSALESSLRSSSFEEKRRLLDLNPVVPETMNGGTVGAMVVVVVVVVVYLFPFKLGSKIMDNHGQISEKLATELEKLEMSMEAAAEEAAAEEAEDLEANLPLKKASVAKLPPKPSVYPRFKGFTFHMGAPNSLNGYLESHFY
ncbi:uncharacterized protein [Coffea arabica]|uniref:Uncharacterized protein n=1 Tax=Coffea arabica TaxID=13443 RepID=A0ABM4UKH9_COFAR